MRRPGGFVKEFALLLMAALCLKAQAPVQLGTAASFAVLAGSTVTNTGATVVNGNLGLSPGSSVTGFPPGVVINGSEYVAVPVAAQAQIDLTSAYNSAVGRTCPGTNVLPGDIGGTVVTPGVYCNSTSVGITGTVTLSGNSSSVFIFQIGSTLTTAGNSVVLLSGGVLASNVFWQVGTSATLGTNTTFAGTIMAQDSITVDTGAALNGRALARTGAVSLADNAMTIPSASITVVCSYPSGQVGVPYSSSLVATGGAAPYAYTIPAGSLPPGLTLNVSTGAITGTPTAAGSFSDTSRVVDSLGASSTSGCGITIVPAAAPGAPLSLTCASSSGLVGQLYISSMVASGGTAPYTYSISSGSLPPGLTLDPSTGAISGTPAASGSFSYTSGVVDSLGASSTGNCGPLMISAAGPATPAPPSLILVLLALALAAAYMERDWLVRLFGRS
jgi:hypothetical protein